MMPVPIIETEAQYETYRRLVFDFLWNEVEPLAADLERGKISAETLFPQFSEHGLFGLIVPREFGGTLSFSNARAITRR